MNFVSVGSHGHDLADNLFAAAANSEGNPDGWGQVVTEEGHILHVTRGYTDNMGHIHHDPVGHPHNIILVEGGSDTVIFEGSFSQCLCYVSVYVPGELGDEI